MANQGFGPGGFAAGGFGMNDFESLARQYWGAWGEQLRGAATPAQPAVPGWNEAVAWWSQFARSGNTQANETLDRFNSQARGWFGQMQQLAAQFAGQDASAAQVAGAWRRMLGDRSFADVFTAMQGPGQQGFEQWYQQMAPYLQTWQTAGSGLLGMPAFGFAREHQERWQQLAQAQLDYQRDNQAYQALMLEAGREAFAVFEAKLEERAEQNRQIDTARGLFDLWIDAAEEAYAQVAMSPRFRESYGAYVNSQMRLRGAVQREVEQVCAMLGIPGRTEVDSAHRKIVELEREMRRLRDALAQWRPTGTAGTRQSADASAPDAAASARSGKGNATASSARQAARAASRQNPPASGAANARPPAASAAAGAGTTATPAQPSAPSARSAKPRGKKR